ncbi:HPr family phosphocarrier protein [Oerskovia turbata]|uniref:Phosphocarrier protein HPr n=5 Tax=Oerskovia TaxID=162491 RepID=A0A4Q1KRK3_9CELL|nr:MULTISPECIES: HPr family phosphocarrier protein [Oerskovia]TGJ95604.1 HPr family phosphocarrier protein [Actinotalea fermentans ATCC 43279 = JCM 9966 = DSM 3133]MBD7952493.1 HPr family phosphocarrier protein [Oerskovia rustica]MBD7998536.1 HPr family phosphocarrier protein [Oerskovia gallyi]MBM7479679.1 phosphocarrier protein [Oerskovia jenensis]MBM7498957.1 phosphocarrier protein [Oerskovia paurometabola]
MERTVTVAIAEGLHARPAALFVAEAGKQPVAVTLTKEGAETVDAASILGVMTLGAAAGDQVVLATETDGAEAEAALDALAEFLGRETV